MECRSGGGRIAPIAFADVRSAHPHLADVVGCEPPPGFRIHNRDALADNISAAADHTMRIVVACGGADLMALKALAADRPYDRPGAPASPGAQYCRFGPPVARAQAR